MELLKNFNFIKGVTPLYDTKTEQISEVSEAVAEYNLVKKGEIKARDAEDLINEL